MNRDLLKRGDITKLSDSLFFRGTKRTFVNQVIDDEECELKCFQKGDQIFSPKTYQKSVGFILSGTVSVHKGKDREFNMSTLESGSYFGVAAVFSMEEEYVTVLTAVKECRILFIHQNLLQRLMRENYEITENYIRFLTDRIHFLNSKIQDLSADSSERALAGYLLSHANQSSPRVFELCGSYSELSERLNIGRASLYRALDRMIENGLIEKKGKIITIWNQTGLETVR